MTRDNAEMIAIKALQFVTGDDDLLIKFLETSGLTPQGLREAATKPDFWAATLAFMRQHDEECAAFASNNGLSVHDLEAATHILETPITDRTL